MDAGQVPLRIEVNEQRRCSRALQGSPQIECGGGFAHAAFLIEDRYSHGWPVLYRALFFT